MVGAQSDVVRWPLATDESGLTDFARTLAVFKELHTLHTLFWTTQGMTILALVVLVLDAFKFQKRLGAVTDTLCACWCGSE